MNRIARPFSKQLNGRASDYTNTNPQQHSNTYIN